MISLLNDSYAFANKRCDKVTSKKVPDRKCYNHRRIYDDWVAVVKRKFGATGTGTSCSCCTNISDIRSYWPVLTSLYIFFYHLLIYLIINDFWYFVFNISIAFLYIIKFFFSLLFVLHQFSYIMMITHILIIWLFSIYCKLLLKLIKFCWFYPLVDVCQLPSLMSGPLSSALSSNHFFCLCFMKYVTISIILVF